MQVKKILCFVLCLVFFLPSCAKQTEPELTSTTSVSTAKEETTLALVAPNSADNSATQNHLPFDEYLPESQKIFFDYEYCYEPSNKFIICYSNADNEENFYHEGNKYGIADKKENIIISPRFTYIVEWTKDRFYVENAVSEKNTEVAVINSEGEFVIPFCKAITHLDSSRNNNIYYRVYLDYGEFYLVDNSGNKVYEQCFGDYYGYNIYKNLSAEHYGVLENKLYVFDSLLNLLEVIDENPVENEYFNKYLGMEYFITLCFKNNHVYYGIVNKTTGKEIVPCKYDKITCFANDRILAELYDTERVTISSGMEQDIDTVAIYDFYGNVICPEGTYNGIGINEQKSDSQHKKIYKAFEPIGVAVAYNPNGERFYGDMSAWLIDKNGIKISDKYYSIYYNNYGEMAGYYTADRGDRVFYLDRYGKVVGAIGQ